MPYLPPKKSVVVSVECPRNPGWIRRVQAGLSLTGSQYQPEWVACDEETGNKECRYCLACVMRRLKDNPDTDFTHAFAPDIPQE